MFGKKTKMLRTNMTEVYITLRCWIADELDIVTIQSFLFFRFP